MFKSMTIFSLFLIVNSNIETVGTLKRVKESLYGSVICRETNFNEEYYVKSPRPLHRVKESLFISLILRDPSFHNESDSDCGVKTPSPSPKNKKECNDCEVKTPSPSPKN